MIPKADYTALGHIHSAQDLGGCIFYSGAITKLNVKNKDLSVNIIESENGKLVDVKTVKLKNPSRYEKVVASSIEDASDKLLNFDNLDIVELEIVQNEPLSASSLKQLKKEFPCISNISLSRPASANQATASTKRTKLNDVDLFSEFYKSVRGIEPSADLIEMFSLCKGDDNETN